MKNFFLKNPNHMVKVRDRPQWFLEIPRPGDHFHKSNEAACRELGWEFFG